ncbi:thioredoxin-like domain-containing protein [Desulfonatronum parangueonense]
MRVLVFLIVTFLFPVAAMSEELTLHDILQRPELGPTECTLTRNISLTSGVQFNAGQKMVILEYREDQVLLINLDGRTAFTVDYDDTDILDISRSIFSKLTPKQRSLTMEKVLQSPELWPYKVKQLISTYYSSSKNPRGLELYLTDVNDHSLLLTQPDHSFSSEYPFVYTDFFVRARENLESGAPGRLLEDLQGKLIDAVTGKQFQIDPAVRYIIIYRGAQWCPGTRKLTPEVIKLYKEIKQNNPEYELVYVPAEKSSLELQKYAAEMNFPWPVVAFHSADELAVVPQNNVYIPAIGMADIYGNTLIDMSKHNNITALEILKTKIFGQE